MGVAVRTSASMPASSHHAGRTRRGRSGRSGAGDGGCRRCVRRRGGAGVTDVIGISSSASSCTHCRPASSACTAWRGDSAPVRIGGEAVFGQRARPHVEVLGHRHGRAVGHDHQRHAGDTGRRVRPGRDAGIAERDRAGSRVGGARFGTVAAPGSFALDGSVADVTVLFSTHAAYLEHLAGPRHPERPERLQAVLSGVQRHADFDALVPLEPIAATREDLERVHPSDLPRPDRAHLGQRWRPARPRHLCQSGHVACGDPGRRCRPHRRRRAAPWRGRRGLLCGSPARAPRQRHRVDGLLPHLERGGGGRIAGRRRASGC